MIGRPLSLILAAALLITIGGSGLLAGGSLIGAAGSAGPTADDVRAAGFGIGAIIGVYALAALIAGIGLFLLRRWAWGLGLLTTVVGLVAQAGAIAGIGNLDSILLLGVIIWGATLAFLVAPPTRRAARR